MMAAYLTQSLHKGALGTASIMVCYAILELKGQVDGKQGLQADTGMVGQDYALAVSSYLPYHYPLANPFASQDNNFLGRPNCWSIPGKPYGPGLTSGQVHICRSHRMGHHPPHHGLHERLSCNLRSPLSVSIYRCTF